MRLRELGHDAVHTADLPGGNRTSDRETNRLSILEQCIVLTKDADFIDSLILTGSPYKLLLVSTGNIRNAELEGLLLANIAAIEKAFAAGAFVEMDRTTIRVHF